MKTILIFKNLININIDSCFTSFNVLNPLNNTIRLIDFILVPIFLICLAYTAVSMFKIYCLLRKSPKKQSKWIQERFPEEEKEKNNNQ
jgi:uncharacterized membrane protein